MLHYLHELLRCNNERAVDQTERDASRRHGAGPIQKTPLSTLIPARSGPIPTEFKCLQHMLDASSNDGVDAIVPVTREVLLSPEELSSLSVEQARHRFKYLIKALQGARVCSCFLIQPFIRDVSRASACRGKLCVQSVCVASGDVLRRAVPCMMYCTNSEVALVAFMPFIVLLYSDGNVECRLALSVLSRSHVSPWLGTNATAISHGVFRTRMSLRSERRTPRCWLYLSGTTSPGSYMQSRKRR
jgi:hypothetical protein